MTKSGLIEDVARRTPHISKKDTEVVVNTIFDSMIEALKDGPHGSDAAGTGHGEGHAVVE